MSRSLAQHWHGTLAYTKVLALEAAGKPVLVPPMEAEKRAVICVECPKNNLKPKKSRLELAEDALMIRMADGRRTQVDKKLGSCMVCTCNLKALVHVVPSIATMGLNKTSLAKYPEHCWKRTLLP